MVDESAVHEKLKALGASTLEELSASLGLSPATMHARLESLRSRQLVKRSPKGKWFVPGFTRGGGSEVPSAGLDACLEQITALAEYARFCAYEEEDSSSIFEQSDQGTSWLYWPDAREWSAAGGHAHSIESTSQFREVVMGPGARLVYGYPTWVRQDASGWKAIPVLTQAVEVLEASTRSLRVALADEFPQVNPAFLQECFDSAEDRRVFVEQLGLLGDEVEAGVSVDSCALRLVEDGLPYPLEWVGSPLGQPLNVPGVRPDLDEGVHNAAIIGLARGLKYRKSLAGELGTIAEIDRPLRFAQTSLGALFGLGPAADSISDVLVGTDLPLDDVQRQVVASALGAPITVVTGPPGTGKSQVVTSILANALLNGRTALFASLNHKAVEVVEQKLNTIAGHRAMLRAGRAREDRCHLEEVAEEVDAILGGVVPDVPEHSAGVVGAGVADARIKALRTLSKQQSDSLEDLADAARTMVEGDWTGFPGWVRAFPVAKETLPLWCVTNLSVKWSFPLTPGLFDLLIIDEASQCDIGSALPLMYRARHAVVIGDSKQLRHVTSMSSGRSRQLASQARLPDELFARVDHSQKSLFDFAAQSVGEDAVLSLTGHYRCHPEIIGFPNRQWYESAIAVLTDASKLPVPGTLPLGMYWLPIRSSIEQGATGVIVRDEAEIIVSRVHSLLVEEGFDGTVGIVTPFRAQHNLIEAMLEQRIELSVRDRARLLVRTVHGFQGDERDVIFLSSCLRPGITRGSYRFLKETDNLLNVAVTRARSSLVVVGDLEACRECGIEHYEALALYWDALISSKSEVDARMKADKALFRRLIEWRRGRALLEGTEPKRILPDDTLRAIALVRPRDETELLAIKGFGPAKANKYGSEVLGMVGSGE